MPALRQTNLELCRIVAMLLVMTVHTTFVTIGWETSSFVIQMLAAFSIIGVNVFVLLTGYFSTTPKISSISNLVFICFFWMMISFGCKIIFHQELSYRDLFFITNSNWFIPSYITLLFFTPILNSFCNLASKRQLWGGVFLLILLQFWFDWLPPYPVIRICGGKGYGVFPFCVLYLLARAIRLHGVPKWLNKYSIWFYFSCSVIIGVGAHFFAKLGYGTTDVIGWWYAYNNPLVILSSVAFLLTFVNIKMPNNKVINHIAKSALACLFGHSAIFYFYTRQFMFLFDNYFGFRAVFYWVLSIVIVFCASVIMDQIRMLLYKPIDALLCKKINNDRILC